MVLVLFLFLLGETAMISCHPWTGTPGSGKWVDLYPEKDGDDSGAEKGIVLRCRSYLYQVFGPEVDQLTDAQVLECCAD